MKKILTLNLLLLTGLAFGQQTTGIRFQHGLSWEQIRAKAKAENKYIFLDAFTTWCGPCKQMANNIFPLKEVGDFYNANFLNVKVQLDVTKNDDDEVKKWYEDAKAIKKDYEIRAFPTYLYFNPEGELVHRVIGSSPASTFIERGKNALDPGKQYFTLKRLYEQGKRDQDFLFQLTQVSREAGDDAFLQSVAQEYLATQKDLLKPDNLRLLVYTTRQTSDPGFDIFLNKAVLADSVVGQGRSRDIVKNILINQLALPYIQEGAKPAPASPVIILGKLRENVDWEKLKAELDNKYPQLADEVVFETKIRYFGRSRNLPALAETVDAYLKKQPQDLNKGMLNNFAWEVFQKSDDPKLLNMALSWSKASLEGTTEPMFMDTYANLLYKTGKKEEAIKLEDEAVRLSGEKEGGTFHKVLEKMKSGEKTW